MSTGPDPSVTASTEFDAQVQAHAPGQALGEGTRIGSYRIRRALGEGGMGQVYLAEQTAPIHRDVALKLMREQIASPLALAWFEVERQALAQMQHPAIAQIFDAGTTPEGHAFIAMEHVEGKPLAEFCTSHALGRDQRLALFVRVCQGVQHAHQKGVIHRDLKPANVLVREIDGVPSPKIIDFGIAVGGGNSAHGPRVENASADHAGTAIYMSPEQAAGKGRNIDTRSDVYALGVMLYEILTGNAAATLASNIHRSRAVQTPGGMSTASPDSPRLTSSMLIAASESLPLELRAILQRALAEDRNDRYASATALAEDLERYRDHRPVLAMPQGRVYSMRKFVRRHRLGIVAAGIAAIALIAGTVLAVQGQRKAEAAAELAQIEADKARQIADFVQQMIAGIDPDRAKGLDRELMRLMLDSSAERAGSELATQPQVRAAIERTIAQSYAAISEQARSAEHFAAAREAATKANLPVGERARLLMGQASALGGLSRFDEGLKLAQQALDEVQGLPESDRDRLFIESRLAWLEQGAGQFDASITHYQHVLPLQQAAFGADDDDSLESQRGLAAAYARTDRFAEAEPLLKDVLERYRKRYGDAHSKTLDLTTGLAVTYLEQEKYAQAEALLGPALPVAEKLLGPNHQNTVILVSNLGSSIRQQGRNAEARPYYERVLATNLKLHGPDHFLSVSAESNLALLLRDAGEGEEAERHARLSVAHLDKAFPPGHPARAIFIDALARVLTSNGKYAEAEKYLDQAYALFLAAPGFGPAHSRTRDCIKDYIALYAAWKKPELEQKWKTTLASLPRN